MDYSALLMSVPIVPFYLILSNGVGSTMGQIYSLEHALYEDPVYITRWLKDRQVSFHAIRLFEGERLPDQNNVGLLIIMGGPMNIYEDEKYPWLKQEKEFIKSVIEAGRPVLGICLGAQLISDVLGGKVTRAEKPEYGWHTIYRIPGIKPLLDDIPELCVEDLFPDTIEVFQWHQDTFSIPPEATRLYESEGCLNQAFIYMDRVFGFQFHPEMDKPTIEGFLTQSVSELREKGTWHIRNDILSQIDLCYTGQRFIAGIMQYLLKKRRL